ncbi:MAG: hypothetical protein V1770_00150 [bacterium]
MKTATKSTPFFNNIHKKDQVEIKKNKKNRMSANEKIIISDFDLDKYTKGLELDLKKMLDL